MSRSPVLAHSREELEAAVGGLSAGTHLVPTMGALHEGHATLIRLARAQADEQSSGAGPVVVSVFVNPTQFAPGEDFERYPRTFESDLELVSRSGADVVFAPSVEVMYPGGDPLVTVDPGPLGGVLEGAVRPTHFRGVLTVVAKLFGLVGPRAAYFGEKDFQQLVLIRRMAADLCQGVDVVGVPTVREPDGLALSSRNAYLDAVQRTQALALSRALLAGRDAATQGADHALSAAHQVLDGEAGLDLDYLELTGPELGPPPAQGPARLLVAGRVGSTRLIDNLALELGRGLRR